MLGQSSFVVFLSLMFFVLFFSNIISSVVCSTLVIKQKLPGIYVQPSYKSALSKNCEVHICCFYLLLIDSLLNVQSSSINTTHVSVLWLKVNSISFWTLYLRLCMLLHHVINDLVSKNVNYFFYLVWFGVIFIRHGLYQDGVFKFTVYIPDNYPDGDCPVSSSY